MTQIVNQKQIYTENIIKGEKMNNIYQKPKGGNMLLLFMKQNKIKHRKIREFLLSDQMKDNLKSALKKDGLSITEKDRLAGRILAKTNWRSVEPDEWDLYYAKNQ